MDERIARRNKQVQEMLNNVPHGRPKSGKAWKDTRKASHTQLRLGKDLKTSFKEKIDKKAELKSVKEFENRLKNERIERLQARRHKAKEKKQRKLENEKKNEIVTPIRNLHKIKKTKKKFLRSVKS
ncbi:coiled-coil domain-containing protein 86 [Patella vulgata]|uniref:coiled-coil domain-containing protein 86 n=1 Tax=Patella vulgata TaxID=6465 RepID=UPI00217F788D|nr:coiled-coil domain-containing protein 86 [Patella vulgata]